MREPDSGARHRRLDRTDSAPVPQAHRRPRSAYLVVLSGPQLGEAFPIPEGREIVMGRGEGVDIRVVDEGVSRRHAAVRTEGFGAAITDLGSHNGTFVEGARVAQHTLVDGARIQLGFSTALKFTFADDLEVQAQRKLLEAAVRDPLTGLYNRRFFLERLAAMLAGVRRHHRSLSLLLLDVDRFKEVNDRQGHAEGDRALVRIANALLAVVRRDELLARIGGDEFVVLGEADEEGATVVAENLCSAVAATGLTVSVGVAMIPESGAGAQLPGEEQLLHAADGALYQAKAAGGNRSALVIAGAP